MTRTALLTDMAKARRSGAGADVVLNCEGKTVLAHSLFLNMRYRYPLWYVSSCIKWALIQVRVLQDCLEHKGWWGPKHSRGAGVLPLCPLHHHRLHIRDLPSWGFGLGGPLQSFGHGRPFPYGGSQTNSGSPSRQAVDSWQHLEDFPMGGKALWSKAAGALL